jgi:hypothetical protein
MTHFRLLIVGVTLIAAPAAAQTNVQAERGPASAEATAGQPYARIAIFHPRDGDTVDFEAGYMRHLAWHQQAKDRWAWYGWTITYGERQRWFVYASFGHSAAAFDNPVPPADDERDNVLNVAPHVEEWTNGLYEYLPALSRGTAAPTPAARLELTTIDLKPNAAKAFETALTGAQATLQDETLWYRMVAGGNSPRYVRLRPRPSLAAILDGSREQALPDNVNELIAKTTIEILTLRPTMSYGLAPDRE